MRVSVDEAVRSQRRQAIAREDEQFCGWISMEITAGCLTRKPYQPPWHVPAASWRPVRPAPAPAHLLRVLLARCISSPRKNGAHFSSARACTRGQVADAHAALGCSQGLRAAGAPGARARRRHHSGRGCHHRRGGHHGRRRHHPGRDRAPAPPAADRRRESSARRRAEAARSRWPEPRRLRRPPRPPPPPPLPPAAARLCRCVIQALRCGMLTPRS
jgi:hypothetical protein